MDVLDFIDSPDIRAYCKHHTFSPAEQAVLCLKSNQRSYAEKMAFVSALLDVDPYAPFPLTEFCTTWDIRSELQQAVVDWNLNPPEKGDNDPQVVYVTGMKFLDSRDEYGGHSTFSTYQKAYENLCATREGMLDEDSSPVLSTIEKVRIDHPEKTITYTLNKDLQVIKTSGFQEDFEFDVPVPFQTGDILYAAAERYATTASFNEDAFFCVAAERTLDSGEITRVFARFLGNEVYRLCGHAFRLRLRYATEDDDVPENIVELANVIRRGDILFYSKRYPITQDEEDEG